MLNREKKHYQALETLLTVCSECKPHEKILIVTDPPSLEVALAMYDAAERFPNKSMIMMDARTMHAEEPTELVAAAMMNADVIFRATKFSLSHCIARRNATENGARDLNMADYDMRMLESGGLYVDYVEAGKVCTRMGEALKGDELHITSKAGTDFRAKITGRQSQPQLARSIRPGQTSSPPDIECAIGGIKGTANGVVMMDGSIPHPRLGLIKEPIKLTFKESMLVNIEGGEQAKTLRDILEAQTHPGVWEVGEIGVGLNPACKLTGRMLEDEGCYGTIHLALGENFTLGGDVDIEFHLDMVMRDPSLIVDGKTLMDNGKVVI